MVGFIPMANFMLRFTNEMTFQKDGSEYFGRIMQLQNFLSMILLGDAHNSNNKKIKRAK